MMSDQGQVALAISVFALAVAILSLWINSLSPYRLLISHDQPTFRLYRISASDTKSPGSEGWWIPSFDLGITFYNSGRRPGQVTDIRIICRLDGRNNTRSYVFYPKWLVEYPVFNKMRSDRFEWISTAVLRDWYPMFLGGQAEKSVHVILETDRWEHKMEGVMRLELEVVSARAKRWTSVASYKLDLSGEMFDSKSSYSPGDKELIALRKLGL